jgi:hypothetical protein
MQANQFSPTRMRLRHYRSIVQSDVRLGQLLFLVGPKGDEQQFGGVR